jgi:putative transposase
VGQEGKKIMTVQRPLKSLKVRLEFNNEQQTYARQHCGVARHAWNWGLSVCQAALERNEKCPSAIDLHKKLVAEVKSENPWYYDVSKCAPQQALRDLNTAFKRYFKKVSRFPNFKKRGQKDHFYTEGAIEVDGDRIKLPRFGWVKMSESVENRSIKNCVLSRTANEWFVAFKVPSVPIPTVEKKAVVGVDLGIQTLATFSDGHQFANKRAYKKYKRKLKLAQRQVSKKFKKGQKQSKNYQKAALKVAKIHQKVANVRKDALHKLTTSLSKNHAEVVIEDLNLKGMSQNHKLASAILDGGFYEFRRQLTYKCDWYGSKLTVVDRFYPSSKTCSSCSNVKKELALKERTYCCEHCGLEIDRDLNAAINLRNQSVSYTAVNACGVSKPPDDSLVGDTGKQEADGEIENVQDCVSSA